MFVSGQLALTPGAPELVGDGIGEQTEQVFANLRAILEAAGQRSRPGREDDRLPAEPGRLPGDERRLPQARRRRAAGPGDGRGVGAPVGRAGRDRRDCPRLTRSPTSCVPLDLPRGEGVYLVGGTVRDILLGRESFDVDIAVEGDAIAFAERPRRRGDRARPVRDGGRALSGRAALDVVTARRETYAAPAALPDVEAGTIEDDLARRDFTVNAIAASLGERLRPAGRPARRPRRPRGAGRSGSCTTGRSSTTRRGSSGRSATRAGSASGWTRRPSGSRGRASPASACSRRPGCARRWSRCSPRTGRSRRSTGSPTSRRAAELEPGLVERLDALRDELDPDAPRWRVRLTALAAAHPGLVERLSLRRQDARAVEDAVALAPRAGRGDRPGRDRRSRRSRARGARCSRWRGDDSPHCATGSRGSATSGSR